MAIYPPPVPALPQAISKDLDLSAVISTTSSIGKPHAITVVSMGLLLEVNIDEVCIGGYPGDAGVEEFLKP